MRKVYRETAEGPGDGKVFYFFFGVDTVGDLASRFAEISRDIACLNQHGYRVVVESTAAWDDLRRALYEEDTDTDERQTVGFLWSSAPGARGELRAADGHWIEPERVDRWRLGRALDVVVFANSLGDSTKTSWARVTRGARAFGWAGDPATLYTPADHAAVRAALSAFLTDGLGLRHGTMQQAHAPAQPAHFIGDPPPSYTSAFGAPRHFERQPPTAVRQVVAGAAALLGVGVGHSPEDHLDYVELRTTADRVQAVWISQRPHQLKWFAEAEPLVLLESDIGPLRPPANLQHLLETASNLDLGRIVIREGVRKMLAVQVAVPLSLATPQLLASAIVECGRMADWLEHRIFGYDKA